jgi:arylsulfatase A-like enzyme
LAKNGIVFNNAYSCGPVCSSARSTIISGCYGPRTGAHWHRKQEAVKMPEGLRMFPYYLRQAGYYTTNNKKEDYNYLPSEKEGVWDESSTKATFRNRKPGQPFFHVKNHTITHESKLFGGLPKDVDGYTVDPSDVNIFPYHPDTPTFRDKYAQYLTLQTVMDSQVGETIAQLEEDGLMDDTFIFHYGDHGGVLPGGKGYAHNDGLQVAMVVYVPKNWKHLVPAKPGSRVDGFVEFVDLSATVLNLAGIEIPKGLNGKPFLGKGVTLKELNKRDTAFGYAERFDEKYDFVRFLRKGKYTYWRNYQPFNFDGLHNFYRYKQPAFVEWRDLANAGKLNEAKTAFYKARPPEQLFDLERDPHEVNNLADDPKYANVLLEMRRALQDKVKSLPDVGFFPEPVFLSESQGNGEAFGQKNKAQIAKLIDIADLQLRAFPEAKASIEKALNSKQPQERYWGFITCGAFGKQAAPFYAKAEKIAASDPNGLVRVRAAEFLGLAGAADPMPFIYDVLDKTSDPIEANLILNSVALLRDGAGVKVDPEYVKNAEWAKLGGLVKHRANYLSGGTGDVKKAPKQKKGKGKKKKSAKGGSSKAKRLSKADALPRDGWSIASVSSVETKAKGFGVENLLDGDEMTSWQSRWSGGKDPFPHEIVLDMGRESVCSGLQYLPRQDRGKNGRMGKYAVYLSNDGKNWGEPVAQGEFLDELNEQAASFAPAKARYLKLDIIEGYNKSLSGIAELNVLGK